MTAIAGTGETSRAERPLRPAGLARFLGPGWPAAAAAYVLVGLVLVATEVSVPALLAFTAYVLLCLVLPGTLLWRAIDGDHPRPFVTDVVLGTCFAYVVELFWYLAVRAAGVPLLVLAWPVLVVGASLLPRWRSRLWRPREVYRMPAGWSWAMAAMVVFALAFIARRLWVFSPLTYAGRRSNNQDLLYHLSLVAELRHHLPVASPVVDGEPLYYHWFLHAEIAASSWVTGIEPLVLLERLSLAPMIALTLLGTGLLASRLTGSVWWGLLAPVLLITGGTASMAAATGERTDLWLNARLYISPTITYSQLLLVLVLALGLRLLRADPPAPLRLWVVTVIALAGLSASKATVLPFVTAGFLGVVLVGALLRRFERRALVLLALCVVVFLLARSLVFGDESRGVRWDPLELYVGTAVQEGLAESRASAGLGIAALVLTVYLVQQLLFAAGVFGLATQALWRDPRAQFLVAAAAAGTVASFTFAAEGNSQQHFIATTPVVWTVASVWGLSVLLPRRVPVRQCWVLAAVALGAGALAWTVQVLGERAVIGLRSERSAWGLVQPYLLAAMGVAAIVTLSVVVARRSSTWKGMTGAVAVVACLGLGVPSAVEFGVAFARDPGMPMGRPKPVQARPIGVGGVEAARWLRDHSDPDELVATNRHCLDVTAERGCDNRVFWLAAYSERRVLLEGWSYQARTAAWAQELDNRACCLRFWDRELLRVNDRAFHGRPAAVEALRDAHGVRWLVLDQRLPHDLRRLNNMAEVRLHSGDYVVLELPPT